MGISTQVSGQPSNIPIDPFVPGQVVSQRGTGMIKDVETGKITRFGTPTQTAPAPAAQSKPKLPDPHQILQEQLSVNEKEIEDRFTVEELTITETTRNKLRTLDEEFALQEAQLKRKFLGPTPEGKTAQQQVDEYHAARDALISQKQVAATRLEGKIRPDLEKLAARKQQEVTGLQAQFTKKQIELDTIQKLIDAGKIQDPLMGLQQQYEELGINIPLSYLRPDPAQELRDLRQTIEYLRNKMDISKSVEEEMGRSLLTEEELELFERSTKRYRVLMLQQHPKGVNRPKMSDANKDMLENKGGTIGGLVGGNKVTKKLDRTGAMTILQEAGGDPELARQIAASRGYKF